jgi:CubicO group peptidase (beta-lactamase class C family)
MTWIQLPTTALLTGGQGWLGYDLTDDAYRDAFTYFENLGYRLTDLWGYAQGDPENEYALYACIWIECRGHPAQFTDHAIAFTDFQATFDTQTAAGFAPVRIGGYSVGTSTMFAAIWEQNGNTAWAADHNLKLSAADLTTHIQQVQQMGYRITDLSAYMLLADNPDNPGGPQVFVPHFSSVSVVNDGRQWMITSPVALNSFQDFYDEQASKGWRPLQLCGYGDVPNVLGRWEGKPTSAYGFCSPNSNKYLEALNLARTDLEQPTSIGAFNQLQTLQASTGAQYPPQYFGIWGGSEADEGIPPLAEDFLRIYDIPGLSLAVAYNGRLAYAGGFGTANKTTGETVQITSQFRIASLSKAITATMIFLMIDRKQLFLDDLVFGPNGKLSSFGQPVDPRVNQITVHHLLQHAGGGWANDANDPMYTHPELYYPSDLVKTVIATRPLDNAPGTAYAYSNFGYCVLGRVIEAALGFTYEYDVKENFAGQLPGYSPGMLIGANTLAERQPNEVVYYGTNDGDPYGILVSRMDSHGGWIGTATDYLRFMVRADGLPTVPDLLSANSMTLMTTPSGLPDPKNNNKPSTYACGWDVGTDGTWSHTGDLAGTRSIMVRTSDGFCWVALVNSGKTVSGDSTRDTLSGLDSLMWGIRDTIQGWNSDPL